LGLPVLVCAGLGIAGGYWLHREFKLPVVPASDLPVARFGEGLAVVASPEPKGPDPRAEMELAAVMGQQNRVEDAKEHYHEAVRIYREELKQKPNSPEVMNDLAWLLASNPYPEIRDGKEAVELAKQACEFSDWRSAVAVGTLAAAYAEAGQFDDAVKTADRARTIALATQVPDVAARNEKLKKLYEARQPYHEAY
jgi:tetratricopeptide (TPR) repeat protein